jgi:hypothetical protein
MPPLISDGCLKKAQNQQVDVHYYELCAAGSIPYPRALSRGMPFISALYFLILRPIRPVFEIWVDKQGRRIVPWKKVYYGEQK